MVSSVLEPWRETGRREPPRSEKGECGPTLRQCLSFADPRNQAVRAGASHRVPGARYTRGACRPSPANQKTRPGGSLPSTASEAWQPWGRDWTPLAVQGHRRLPLASRWSWTAHWLALTSAKTCVSSYCCSSLLAVVVYLLIGTRVSV